MSDSSKVDPRTQHTLSTLRTLTRFYRRNIDHANRTQNAPLRMIAADGERQARKAIQRIEGDN